MMNRRRIKLLPTACAPMCTLERSISIAMYSVIDTHEARFRSERCLDTAAVILYFLLPNTIFIHTEQQSTTEENKAQQSHFINKIAKVIITVTNFIISNIQLLNGIGDILHFDLDFGHVVSLRR